MTGLLHQPGNQVIHHDHDGGGVAREGGGVEIVNCVIIFPVSLLLRVCGSLIIITRMNEINATHRQSVWSDYEGLRTPQSDSKNNIERSVSAKFCHLF